MKEHIADSIASYSERTAKARHWSGVRFVFRGEGDADSQSQLVAGIGRTDAPPNFVMYRGSDENKTRKRVERDVLEEFAGRSAAYLTHRPASLLEVMFYAQHYGLPTRLLDWTFSPLVALYFAVAETSRDIDGAVYVCAPLVRLADVSERGKIEADPLSGERDYLVVPPYIDRRLAAQQGCFTLHARPLEAFNAKDLYRVRIPARAKVSLWRQLDHLGIRPETLFPDLDGLAKSIKSFYFGDLIQPPPKA